jgi:rhodanese-related sulfurtransferase
MSFLEITPSEVHRNIDRFRIIDVRESCEFHGPLGHLEHGEHVPLSTIPEHAKQLAGGRPLLLICRSGKRSGKACESLVKLDASNVTNLVGGMIEWNRSGLPVVRTELKSSTEVLKSVTAWLAQITALDQASATGRIDALLHEAGASLDDPTAAGMDHVLDGLAHELRASAPPPDLQITLDAYRKDLSVL